MPEQLAELLLPATSGLRLIHATVSDDVARDLAMHMETERLLRALRGRRHRPELREMVAARLRAQLSRQSVLPGRA